MKEIDVLVKADFKVDGRNVRLTFSGSFVRVVTKSARGVSIQKYPINNVSGSVVVVALSDDKRDTAFDVCYSPRVPQLGSAYVDERGVTHTDIIFKDFSPRFVGPRGNFFEWEITYTIAGVTSATTTETPQSNDASTILSFSAQIEQEETAGAVDLDGKYNVNSLGLFYDDPLIFKRGTLAMKYSRREYTNPLALIPTFTNAINSRAMWFCDVGTLRVVDITATINESVNETSYNVDYNLAFRPQGWAVVKPNSSYYIRSGNNLTRALNSDGSPTETPTLIALDGTPLTTGTPPYRAFRVYPFADLTALDLPDPRYL